ncbi:glycine cleavage system aminomethyltransferase GcvT [Thermomicrobiaceae bacterium CFH 74404]|uniref:Aminomethyltransferase n=1 Tax=Thermalbibacter longus TaxID=2951981 RepID=A0AA42BBP7_9BACT|nr:glycine cleavage system aminomethyltransferase GcvT [Thermalbibacter longus]MCM8750059.1 glycine cleavage system aminomethyltransferase GcvT [Thermalbibacter longus]
MTELKRTPLAERHQQLGARMIEFAGWYMPVQYKGIIVEHQTVRTIAGLFDLGHMGQVEVGGPDALEFLQYVSPNDVARLRPGEAQYSMLLYPNGGVVDDILIYNRPAGDGYFVVVNAANTEKDVAWLNEQRTQRSDLKVDVIDVSDRTGMLAIQGPQAEAILQRLTRADLSEVEYFHAIETDVAGVPAMVARTGYTGEDGFELYFPIEHAVALWDRLLEAGTPDGMLPIGLGARDTLRLEACLPLYGNELSAEITPLEAGLSWVVKFDKGDFIGREALLRQRSEGIPRKLVGFKMVERGGVPRSHCEVQVDGKTVGFVTSGTSSPTLRENIGLALVAREYAGVGRPLDIVIRGRPVRAEQVKTPFYKRAR